MRLTLTIGSRTITVEMTNTRAQHVDNPVEDPPHVIDGPLTDTERAPDTEPHELDARGSWADDDEFIEDAGPRVPGLVINPEPAIRLNRAVGEALRNVHAVLSTKPARVEAAPPARVIPTPEQTQANLRWTAERQQATREAIARRTGRTVGF